MEDRYLFKAKRIDNEEWVQGALFNGESHCIIGQEIKFSPYTEHECKIVGYEVDRDTICQCTGLKDKNGKVIWENDILNSGNLVVTWRKELASYCLSKKGWMHQHFFGEAIDACDCEVIGNIFDNPELLEV